VTIIGAGGGHLRATWAGSNSMFCSGLTDEGFLESEQLEPWCSLA
jgi:hypothetical protein